MFVNIDEKFKDARPADTVNRIKGILNDTGIEVGEKWYESGITECYSVRVSVKGTEVGTNGKGVTKELATASGYAEFMERLQTGFLTGGELDFGDERLVSREELESDKCRFVFEKAAELMNFFVGGKITADLLIDKCFALEGNKDRVRAIPFLDAKSGEFVYIPVEFIKNLYSTNGLAAGNSTEEAVVQGFSEIVERYCQKNIFIKKLTPPTVPEEVLKNYSTAYKIISQIKNAGYEIIIKDCSLGLGYPVVASVLIDKETHAYHVHLGSSPVFEIALERSLTEMFQGRNLNATAEIKGFVTNKSKQLGMSNLIKAYRTGEGAYPVEFFLQEESYPFKEFKSFENCTNLDLLKEVLAYADKMGWRVLVRDMSHLGFGTYRVVVPGVCDSYFMSFISDMPVFEILNDIKDVRRDLTKATADALFLFRSVCNMEFSNSSNNIYHSVITKVPAFKGVDDICYGYLTMAYIEWECFNFAGAYKYAASAESVARNRADRDYLSCLRELNAYINEGYAFEKVVEILSVFYELTTVERVSKVYKEGSNPFKRFIIQCNPEKCDLCRCKNTCSYNVINEIRLKINEKCRAFDNEKAFENIKNTLKRIV